MKLKTLAHIMAQPYFGMSPDGYSIKVLLDDYAIQHSKPYCCSFANMFCARGATPEAALLAMREYMEWMRNQRSRLFNSQPRGYA